MPNATFFNILNNAWTCVKVHSRAGEGCKFGPPQVMQSNVIIDLRQRTERFYSRRGVLRLANAVGGPVCQNASRIEEHNRSQWARAARRLGNMGSSNETMVSHTTTLLKSLPQQDWSKNAYWGR